MNRRILLKSAGLFVLGGFSLSKFAKSAARIEDLSEDSLSEKYPLRLNYNENTLGMSPLAKNAITQISHAEFCRYPDSANEKLKNVIAKLHQINTNEVTTGCGSSTLIYAAVLRTARMENAKLIVADPTFGSTEEYAAAMNLSVERIPLSNDYTLNISSMRKAAESHNGPVLVYLCNPNNPTATITPAEKINAWIQESKSNLTFLVDEAYHEYVIDQKYESAIKWIKDDSKNVIVLRTCSKVFGIAGLRIGYAFAKPSLINDLNQCKQSDDINIIGAVAAVASLNDRKWLNYSVSQTNEARQIVVQAFDELNLNYLPSNANFIMHRVKGSTKQYQNEMKKRHILVGRPFNHFDGWNRLTIGTPNEMKTFISVLKSM